jgi:hypothetical protein
MGLQDLQHRLHWLPLASAGRPGGITKPFRWRLERQIPAAWLPGFCLE